MAAAPGASALAVNPSRCYFADACNEPRERSKAFWRLCFLTKKYSSVDMGGGGCYLGYEKLLSGCELVFVCDST